MKIIGSIIASILTLGSILVGVAKYSAEAPEIRINYFNVEYIQETDLYPKIQIENIGIRAARKLRTSFFLFFKDGNKLLIAGNSVSDQNDLLPGIVVTVATNSIEWNRKDMKPEFFVVSFNYQDNFIVSLQRERHRFYRKCNSPELANEYCAVTEPEIIQALEVFIGQKESHLLPRI